MNLETLTEARRKAEREREREAADRQAQAEQQFEPLYGKLAKRKASDADLRKLGGLLPDLPTENRKRVERVLGVFTREQDLRDGIARYKQCRDRLKELTDAHGDEIAAGVDSMVAREARSLSMQILGAPSYESDLIALQQQNRDLYPDADVPQTAEERAAEAAARKREADFEDVWRRARELADAIAGLPEAETELESLQSAAAAIRQSGHQPDNVAIGLATARVIRLREQAARLDDLQREHPDLDLSPESLSTSCPQSKAAAVTEGGPKLGILPNEEPVLGVLGPVSS